MRIITALLLAICSITSFMVIGGCEVDSFFNPSVTGYYEHTPTSMPILNRIDIIEREVGYDPLASKPTAEDLVPNELQYRLAPGDVVRVEIYELVAANQTDVSVRVIDQSGMIRLPTIGDIPAAGRTIEELQEQIIETLRSLISDPLVTVVLEDGRSFQFTIYGSVSGTGIYALTRPDFRVMDAIALAGGTAITTQRILVIREVAIDENVKPGYERGVATPGQNGDGDGDSMDIRDIDALIEALDGASPAAMASQDTPPIDVDDLSGDASSDDAAAGGDESLAGKVPSGDTFIFDAERQEWIRLTPEEAAARGLRPVTARRSVAPIADDTPSPYATRIIEVDYQALAKGDSDQNIVIRPGDRVYVDTPEVGVVYIDGEVARPGVYQLPVAGRLTLSRLVAAAGGLNALAIPERVDFTRKIGNDRQATLRVNLAAIMNRAEPDLFIRRDDHIHIGTNFWAAPLAVIRNGFRFTYGFGFLLDRNFGNDVFGPPPFAGFNGQ
jgi:polysaccharide export outer membrane protein